MPNSGLATLRNFAKRIFILLAVMVLVFSNPVIVSAQGLASRPILFVHGFCDGPYTFASLLGPLYQKLGQTLYPNSTVFYARYDSGQNKFLFWTVAGSITFPWAEGSIPANARFFSIEFYDPVGGTGDAAHVAKISVLNKAYELSQVIKQITAITDIKDVIVVGHSMGGLDARAYIEGLASPGACYDYNANQPSYNASTCTPGCTSTSTPACPAGFGDAAYAGDVGDLITVDTPHEGSPLADVTYPVVGTLIPALACQLGASTNRDEIQSYSNGASGLIDVLNYTGEMVTGIRQPSENSVSIQAVSNYFSDLANTKSWTGLAGQSDDIVPLSSQLYPSSLQSNSTNSVELNNVSVSYTGNDTGINTTAGCSAIGTPGTFPILHLMSCLGALPNTQTAIANQIIANENGALTPIVKGSQPTLITSSGATLNGTVNTAGSGGRAYFQWSTNANLRSPTIACNDQYVLNCTWISASNSAQAFSTPVGGIASGTKIYYQAVFYTGSTYQYGAIQSFTTLVPAFNVTAASITSSGATLKGTVNTEGSAGYAYFQTSLNANFSSPTMACNDQYVLNCPWVGASTVAQAISTNVFEFASNTNVYYRAAFYNTGNSSYQYGTIQSFKTLAR